MNYIKYSMISFQLPNGNP